MIKKNVSKQSVVIASGNRRLTAEGRKKKMLQSSEAPRSRALYKGRRQVKTD